VADGPRDDRPGEASLCDDVIALATAVEWECDLTVERSDRNMGCRDRFSSGLDYVFSTTDRAIILEDDCLPSLSFFRFCSELLDRYEFDDRVMSVSGTSFQFGRRRTEASYFFSRYTHVWGWATWRRAWNLHDASMLRWPDLARSRWLDSYIQRPKVSRYFHDRLDLVESGALDTWDYPWLLTTWLEGGLCAVPERNLVTNIGFGSDATHTKRRSRFADLPAEELDFPLRHPQHIERSVSADRFTENLSFNSSRLLRAASRRLA
jgi:hypothetical protein